MYRKNLVVRTKLSPPRLHQRILPRPRLMQRLLEALESRLILVQAGTGYGKSTALAALTTTEHPLVWYHLDEEDADPLIFLLHLLHGFHAAFPELIEISAVMPEELESSLHPAWPHFVDMLTNELADKLDVPTLLILDDVHLLGKAPEILSLLDRFIARAPACVHVILSTRYALALPSLLTWQVKGAVLEIGQAELAFTTEEITALFNEHYDCTLPVEQIERIASETEGWAIALQLVWQGLRSGAMAADSFSPSVLPDAEQPTGPTEQLFAYLAQEILAQQPAEIREFLKTTAVLREMTAPICDCLLDSEDPSLLPSPQRGGVGGGVSMWREEGVGPSARILRYLLDNNLFVVDLGGGYVRYHHLFREFLCHQQNAFDARQSHIQAARCCQQNADLEEAMHHFLAAEAFDEAASVIEALGRDMVRLGRLDTLAAWIQTFPPDVLDGYPSFLIYLGDIARLQSRFEEAQGWYRLAEQRYRALGDQIGIGKALRGQARVYLDTVNPSQAESLLQEALRLSDGQEDRESRANLLELMAENRLNLGRSDEAARIAAQAREIREEGPGEAELAVRVLLRTGQLDQARRILERRAEAERQAPVLRPRAHRETLLLLSLILAFQGEAEATYATALEGTERGRVLKSPFITAVGYMRQGHAWLLRNPTPTPSARLRRTLRVRGTFRPIRGGEIWAGEEDGYAAACRCYREAIRLSDTLDVPRLRVEAYWGLCRAHGFRGAMDAAERAAEQGMALAEEAGDEWILALIRASLGAGYFLVGQHTVAAEWLSQAWTGFHECGDAYGQTVTRLWQCLLWLETGDLARLDRGFEDLWLLARENRYDYLFTRKTLQGPPDPRRVVPLLLYARETGVSRAYVERLLISLGLNDLELHPGYQLRVQTLGPFRVWRGFEEVTPQQWRRENARLLFQLLLTYRDQMLEREQIVEMLWPGIDLDTAVRDFKVALSTLFKVLEADRKAGSPSAYVMRDGTLYGLRPEADLWLDVVDFERWAATDARISARSQSRSQSLSRGLPTRSQSPSPSWHVPSRGLPLDDYRRALALYEGDYLQELPYADWCSEARAHFLALYLRTAERLAQALIQGEQWEQTIEVCQAILARDDCWEQAYQLMMVAYAQMGNRVQVLRTYQRCTERLREGLDIAPSDATEHLYAALSKGEPVELDALISGS